MCLDTKSMRLRTPNQPDLQSTDSPLQSQALVILGYICGANKRKTNRALSQTSQKTFSGTCGALFLWAHTVVSE